MPAPHQQPRGADASARRHRKRAWSLEFPPDDVLRMSWRQQHPDAVHAQPADHGQAALGSDGSIFHPTYGMPSDKLACCGGADNLEAAKRAAPASTADSQDGDAADADADAAGNDGSAADGAAAYDEGQWQREESAAADADDEPGPSCAAAGHSDAELEAGHSFMQCSAADDGQGDDHTDFCMVDDAGDEHCPDLEGVSLESFAVVFLAVLSGFNIYTWREVSTRTQCLLLFVRACTCVTASMPLLLCSM